MQNFCNLLDEISVLQHHYERVIGQHISNLFHVCADETSCGSAVPKDVIISFRFWNTI